MKSSEQIDKLIAEQSAEWTEVLKRGDERDLAAFAQWSLKSPEHLRQFLMMTALDQELGQIDPERRIEIPQPAGADGAVVALHERRNTGIASHPRAIRRWAIAAVLMGIAVLAGLQFGSGLLGWREFSTVQGEQRAVELADGSIMHLNTQSQVKVRFSKAGRDIRLFEGEALFKVAKDAARPFRVHTSDVVVQAVGTQFNVYAQHGGTKVSVLEGRVQISPDKQQAGAPAVAPASLGAGEEAKIDARGSIKASRAADVTTLAAWRQRRLVFNQNPLSEVVTEFNRYNRSPQFRVLDEEAAARPYSGAFDADDPESLTELLRLDADLEVQTDGAKILIRRRQ